MHSVQSRGASLLSLVVVVVVVFNFNFNFIDCIISESYFFQ